MPTQKTPSSPSVESTLNDIHATVGNIARHIGQLRYDIDAAVAACRENPTSETMQSFSNEIFRNNLLADIYIKQFADCINHMNGMIGRFDAKIEIVARNQTQKSAD